MSVYVLTYFSETDIGGIEADILGVYTQFERAHADMKTAADVVRSTRPIDFWTDDFTYERSESIALGHSDEPDFAYTSETYQWIITKMEVK